MRLKINFLYVLFVLTLMFGLVGIKVFAMELTSTSNVFPNQHNIIEELRNFNPEIVNTLKKGSKGAEVSQLQNFLINSDYLDVEKPTGYFGAQTETAVKVLQDHLGLKPDGVIGKQTINILRLEPFNSDYATTTKIISGCESGHKFNVLNGKPCADVSDAEVNSNTVSTDNSMDITPRIMMWYGKVNQHTNEKGEWVTDPDGVSGAGNFAQFGNEGYGDRKLEYCQKFYPNTVSFAPYKLETISTWKERGNVNNWTSIKMSYACIGSKNTVSDDTDSADYLPRIMYWSGKVNQHIDLTTGEWLTDPDGVSGANINKLTYCKKWYPNTHSVSEYKLETISTWKERGNVNNWTSVKMSDLCVE